jgi:hypothetical protein
MSDDMVSECCVCWCRETGVSVDREKLLYAREEACFGQALCDAAVICRIKSFPSRDSTIRATQAIPGK